MNVACPECTTVFRVDPAKVPERGVRARCSVCGGLIAVRRPSVGVPAVPPLPSAPAAAVTPPAPVAPEPPTAPPEPTPAPPTMPYSALPDPAAPVTPAAMFEEESAPPAEPTAPVMPFSALPETPAIVSAPVPPPPPPPSPAPAPTPAPAGGGHFTNPFLQQDPGTRARRLARALVSDLVVYHPDKRQRGLSEGNLKELFAEEIRKSWEEYSEQIGEQVARETNYFTEALNEILAEGRPLFS